MSNQNDALTALLTEKTRTTKVLIYSALGLIAAVGGYFFIVRPLQKRAKNVAVNNYDTSTNTGLANTLADQMYLAMKGIGTDEDSLYKAAETIHNNNVTFAQVANAFYNKYGKNLSDWIVSELSSSEYQKFQAILDGKQALSGIDLI